MIKYVICCCYSVAELCLILCNPMYYSTPGFLVLHNLPECAQTHVIELVMPSNHLILCHPRLLLPSIFPSISVFSNELALCIRWSKYWASASVLPMNIQDWFPLDWLVWSPCCPRESQESYSAPHFESINSSALGFLYSPALTSIHEYWKSYSFDYMDLCWQSDISAFSYAI